MFVQLFKRFEKLFVIFKFLVFQQIYVEIKRDVQTRHFCKNAKKYFVTIDFVNAIQQHYFVVFNKRIYRNFVDSKQMSNFLNNKVLVNAYKSFIKIII